MTEGASISVTRRRGYTIVYNDLLPDDGSLSARAWGVYVYLIGRPDGWECRTSHLRTVFAEGRDALYTALRELVAAGLMSKEDYVADGLRRTRYVLDADRLDRAETRRSAPDTDSQEPGDPDPGNPQPGDQHPGNPEPEKPGQATTEGTTTERATTEDTTGVPPVDVDLNAGRDDVDRICAHLSQRLTERQIRHNPETKAWRNAARLMVDLDGRTEQQVHNMIEWSQRHSFWAGVIHSLPNLREKYAKMRDQALRDDGRITTRHREPDSEAAQALARALDGRN